MSAQQVIPLVPDKPTYGEPCNGCGRCCAEQICDMGLEVLDDGGDTTVLGAPCPFLKYHDGRAWCGVIEAAEQKDVAFAAHLKWRLGIDTYCQMEDERV